MDKLLAYIQTYGLSILVIAICVIAIIGILKLCKVFDKIKSSEVKKVIYYALDVVLAFAGSAIYFASFHKDWAGYWLYSIAQLGVTTTLYAIYENFGVRKLVQYLISVISKWFEKNPEAELTKWAEKVGLTESIDKLQALNEQKNTTNNEAVAAETTTATATEANQTKTVSQTTKEIKF